MKNKEQLNVPYSTFAHYYDRLMSGNKYAVWEKLIKAVVEKYSVPRRVALDVACGTGNTSVILTKMGFQVIGIDASPMMLDRARQKVKAKFVQSDIRSFSIDSEKKAVFAISFYDSLNYLLTDKDLLATFKAVKKNLAPGAIFLFDMNTRDHVKAAQKFTPRVFREKEDYIIMHFSGRGRRWILDVDLLIKRSGENYLRHRERHVERGYDEQDVVPLLEKSGLKLLEMRQEDKVYEGTEINVPSRLYFIVQN